MLDRTDTRHKNTRWACPVDGNGRVSHADAQLAVLMDIRDELQTLVTLLRCPNISRALRDLNAMGKMARRRKKKKPGARPG